MSADTWSSATHTSDIAAIATAPARARGRRCCEARIAPRALPQPTRISPSRARKSLSLHPVHRSAQRDAGDGTAQAHHCFAVTGTLHTNASQLMRSDRRCERLRSIRKDDECSIRRVDEQHHARVVSQEVDSVLLGDPIRDTVASHFAFFIGSGPLLKCIWHRLSCLARSLRH